MFLGNGQRGPAIEAGQQVVGENQVRTRSLQYGHELFAVLYSFDFMRDTRTTEFSGGQLSIDGTILNHQNTDGLFHEVLATP
ncbi:MAG: hypothetical protein M3Y72_19530 [Acidobacteriota bacterium]|nr:hypothetical protein [Acidobacteriota bacterium]MDQ2843184.1 hypothetical protein [Acidobacteriota bacterium]